MTVRFFVGGKPIPQGRPRVTLLRGKPHAYNPRDRTGWRQKIAWSAVGRGRFPADVPLAVELDFFFAKPRTSKAQFPPGDCDNLMKGCVDALQECGMIPNDAQIVDWHGTKSWCADPGDHQGVAVTVTALGKPLTLRPPESAVRME